MNGESSRLITLTYCMHRESFLNSLLPPHCFRFNPAYLHDKRNNFSSSLFVDTKTMPELYELVEKYQVEVLWSDGDWDASAEYWKSKEFLAWVATNSSVKDTIVWNDRWGKETRCTHGSYWNCKDRYMPNSTMGHYFESCMTLDKHSWGANRRSSAKDYLTTQELLNTLVQSISRNGNLLINVGPSADGTINPIMVDRLLEMGKWLNVNGEAVYGSRSWSVCSEDDDDIHYTRSVDRDGGDVLYAFLTQWKPIVTLHCPKATASTTVRMLGLKTKLQPSIVVDSTLNNGGSSEAQGLTIKLPALTPDIIPCSHVWVLAIEGVENLGPGSPDENVASPTEVKRKLK